MLQVKDSIVSLGKEPNLILRDLKTTYFKCSRPFISAGVWFQDPLTSPHTPRIPEPTGAHTPYDKTA